MVETKFISEEKFRSNVEAWQQLPANKSRRKQNPIFSPVANLKSGWKKNLKGIVIKEESAFIPINCPLRSALSSFLLADID